MLTSEILRYAQDDNVLGKGEERIADAGWGDRKVAGIAALEISGGGGGCVVGR